MAPIADMVNGHTSQEAHLGLADPTVPTLQATQVLPTS